MHQSADDYMPRIVTAAIRASVAPTSETEATSGITKLSGSRPLLKVCVAITREKKEMKKKLIKLVVKEIVISDSRSGVNPITVPRENAAAPNMMCIDAAAISI